MDAPRRRLKVLVFCTGNIDPPRSGGDLRIHHLYRELSERGHEIEMHSLVTRNHPLRDVWINERFHLIVEHSAWLDLAAGLDRVRLVPITELPLWLAPLRSWVRKIAQSKGFDIAQFEFPWFARVESAARGPGRVVVYGAHNLEWRWWRARLARMPFAQFWRSRLYRHEIEAIRDAGGAVGCAPADCRWLAKHAPQVQLVPNGFDARINEVPTPERRAQIRAHLGWSDKKVAIFVGSDTPPNREAARFIIEVLAPRMIDQPILFVIAGRVGEVFRGRPEANKKKIELHGPVEDLRSLLNYADVGLNPMASGSGSNIKIADYCAAGLAVLTTRFGLRGWEDLEGSAIVSDLRDFDKALEEATWVGRAAIQAIEPYAWRHGAEKLEQFYFELLSAAS